MYVMALGFGSDLFCVNCDQPFTFLKNLLCLRLYTKETLCKKSIKSVCFEVQGIRLVQDKGIMLAL